MDDNDILPSDQQDQNPIDLTLQAAANAAENLIGKIQMVEVNSSDISQWGYDPVKFQLQILFTNARMYLYENISPLEFEQLMLAPSKGRAFWQLIRRNPVGHPFTRLQ
jgi:KTSC domain